MRKKKGAISKNKQTNKQTQAENIDQKGFIENINRIKRSINDFAHVKLMIPYGFCTFFHVQVEKEQYMLSINCNCLPYRCP